MIASLRSDLYLYNEIERLRIIEIKIEEIRNYLINSSEKIYFSVDDIKIVGMLPMYLSSYFSNQLISEATEIKYCEYVKPGEYDYNSKTKILTVYPEIVYLNNEIDFNFSLLDEFQSFINYVTNALFFNKLKELDWKLKAFMDCRDIRILTYCEVDDNEIDDGVNLEEPDCHEKTVKDISLDYVLKDMDEMKYFEQEISYLDKEGEIMAGETLISDDYVTGKDSSIKKENSSVEISETKPLYLADAFESALKYYQIMKILVEQKKCQPESHIWIGTEKGDYSYLAAILKYLHSQGYYKNKKLTNEQIKEICMNTFKWEISIDCIKKAKPENFDLKIIPLASILDF